MKKNTDVEQIFQNISNSYTVSDAYENWREYRERITGYLVKNTEPRKKVAILGIGESNDIDLKSLYDHFGGLTLVDKNLLAMENALKKYGLVGLSNIEVIQKDFVGISDDDYKNIINICLQDMKKMKNFFSPSATAQKVVKKMDEIYEKVNAKNIDLGIEAHDYVIALGLISQLNAFIEHIWSIVLKEACKQEDSVANRAIEQNNFFVPKFCEALEKIAVDNLFVGVELLEIEKQRGVQGAQQAIDYFKNIMLSSSTVSYSDQWPFMEGKTYQMMILNIKR